MRQIKITSNEAGQRLDRFLKKYLNKSNTSFICKMIRKKNIKLNDSKTSPEEFLKEDDIVTLYLSDETIEKFREEDKPVKVYKKSYDFEVVYEDENILVVNKPTGLSSQPDSLGDDNLVAQIQSYLNISESVTFKPAICNRLDKNTSGLVIASKNYDTLKQVNRAIRDRDIKKYYEAKVHGVINSDLRLENYIVKDYDNNKMKVVDSKLDNSKKITTYIQPVSYEDNCTWLNIELVTGRTHQIRAHLSSIGHPIVGDRKYGTSLDKQKTQILHAYKIVFDGLTGNLEYLNGKVIEKHIAQRDK